MTIFGSKMKIFSKLTSENFEKFLQKLPVFSLQNKFWKKSIFLIFIFLFFRKFL